MRGCWCMLRPVGSATAIPHTAEGEPGVPLSGPLEAFAPVSLELLAREKMTTVAGVPTQLALMLRQPDFDTFDLSTVRYIIAGGGPVTPGLAEEARRRFGALLATRYSCTEAGIGCGTPSFQRSPAWFAPSRHATLTRPGTPSGFATSPCGSPTISAWTPSSASGSALPPNCTTSARSAWPRGS